MQSSGVTVLNAIDTSVRAEVVDKYTVIVCFQKGFDLGKSFLDRIQVRTVWREESNKSPNSMNHLYYFMYMVDAGIVHDYYRMTVPLKGWSKGSKVVCTVLKDIPIYIAFRNVNVFNTIH